MYIVSPSTVLDHCPATVPSARFANLTHWVYFWAVTPSLRRRRLPVAVGAARARRLTGGRSRGPHRHLVLSSVVVVESAWDRSAVGNDYDF
jgi:hypothetical protein